LGAFWDFVLEFAPDYLEKLAHPELMQTARARPSENQSAAKRGGAGMAR
jgi:hypothetical protein